MKLWPEVRAIERSSADPDEVLLRLHVPPDLAYFPGHFPGLPVLPGVVQLHWAARLAEKHLGCECKGSRVEQLKFLAIVRPLTELSLTLRVDRAGDMLHFAYADAGRICSSGRMSLR